MPDVSLLAALAAPAAAPAPPAQAAATSPTISFLSQLKSALATVAGAALPRGTASSAVAPTAIAEDDPTGADSDAPKHIDDAGDVLPELLAALGLVPLAPQVPAEQSVAQGGSAAGDAVLAAGTSVLTPQPARATATIGEQSLATGAQPATPAAVSGSIDAALAHARSTAAGADTSVNHGAAALAASDAPNAIESTRPANPSGLQSTAALSATAGSPGAGDSVGATSATTISTTSAAAMAAQADASGTALQVVGQGALGQPNTAADAAGPAAAGRPAAGAPHATSPFAPSALGLASHAARGDAGANPDTTGGSSQFGARDGLHRASQDLQPERADPAAASIDSALAAATTGPATPSGLTAPAHVRPSEVVNQIAHQAELYRLPGNRGVRIQLHPEDLGGVDVTLRYSASGGIQLHINVEHAATAHLVQSGWTELRDALATQGISPDRLVMSISAPNDAGGLDFSSNNSGGNRPDQNLASQFSQGQSSAGGQRQNAEDQQATRGRGWPAALDPAPAPTTDSQRAAPASPARIDYRV